MNDLSKKEETKIEATGAVRKEASSSNELLQNKLESFLLLYYQAYLKGETVVEPEIRAAFLSLIQQDQDLAFKVRMLQLDYLKLEHIELEGEWNDSKEDLFPKIDAIDKPIAAHRKNTIEEYKETILDLIN
ncbi:MAG: hypothetical protein AB8B59_04785 [Maribacter sp.]